MRRMLPLAVATLSVIPAGDARSPRGYTGRNPEGL
jgi:hypothetical protein